MSDQPYSRNTYEAFARARHYVSVRFMQGVPLVDADLNEQDDARRAELRTFLRWFVGDGTPEALFSSFRVEASSAPNDVILRTHPGAGGLYYADGLEARIDADVAFSAQRYRNAALANRAGVAVVALPAPPASGTRTDFYVLDVWEREVDAGEDPDLVDDRIGLPSARRLRREWAVRAMPSFPVPAAARQAGHAYALLAEVTRRANTPVIAAGDIVDRRRTGLAIPSLADLRMAFYDAFGDDYPEDRPAVPLRDAINLLLERTGQGVVQGPYYRATLPAPALGIPGAAVVANGRMVHFAPVAGSRGDDIVWSVAPLGAAPSGYSFLSMEGMQLRALAAIYAPATQTAWLFTVEKDQREANWSVRMRPLALNDSALGAPVTLAGNIQAQAVGAGHINGRVYVVYDNAASAHMLSFAPSAPGTRTSAPPAALTTLRPAALGVARLGGNAVAVMLSSGRTGGENAPSLYRLNAQQPAPPSSGPVYTAPGYTIAPGVWEALQGINYTLAPSVINPSPAATATLSPAAMAAMSTPSISATTSSPMMSSPGAATMSFASTAAFSSATMSSASFASGSASSNYTLATGRPFTTTIAREAEVYTLAPGVWNYFQPTQPAPPSTPPTRISIDIGGTNQVAPEASLMTDPNGGFWLAYNDRENYMGGTGSLVLLQVNANMGQAYRHTLIEEAEEVPTLAFADARNPVVRLTTQADTTVREARILSRI